MHFRRTPNKPESDITEILIKKKDNRGLGKDKICWVTIQNPKVSFIRHSIALICVWHIRSRCVWNNITVSCQAKSSPSPELVTYVLILGEKDLHLHANYSFLEIMAIFRTGYSISNTEFWCVNSNSSMEQFSRLLCMHNCTTASECCCCALPATVWLSRVRQLNGRHIRKQAVLIVACDGLHFA